MHFLAQDDLAGAEVAFFRRRFFAHVIHAVFVNVAAALWARTQRLLPGKIDFFGFAVGIVLAEIELELEVAGFLVGHDAQDGGERPAHFRTEALQRTDFTFDQQLFHFRNFKLPSTGNLRN